MTKYKFIETRDTRVDNCENCEKKMFSDECLNNCPQFPEGKDRIKFGYFIEVEDGDKNN